MVSRLEEEGRKNRERKMSIIITQKITTETVTIINNTINYVVIKWLVIFYQHIKSLKLIESLVEKIQSSSLKTIQSLTYNLQSNDKKTKRENSKIQARYKKRGATQRESTGNVTVLRRNDLPLPYKIGI